MVYGSGRRLNMIVDGYRIKTIDIRQAWNETIDIGQASKLNIMLPALKILCITHV
jgi:hypothetical protein